MKKILFINSKEQKCGVYQYGTRVANIIQNSKKMHVRYAEVASYDELLLQNIADTDVIIFNYIDVGPGGPFDWLTYNTTTTLKNNFNIKIGTIRHTPQCRAHFDLFIDQDPAAQNSIPRPLYNFDTPQDAKSNELLTIGSFGFQGARKGFDTIINIVNDQLDSATINLNITSNYYGDADMSQRDNLIKQLKTINTKPGVHVNITTDFLDNDQILNFLYKNDINLFLYKENHSTASTIDYAITVGKPIGVTSDNSLKHIYTEQIDIAKYSIKQIIDFCNTNNYISNFKDMWCNDKLLEKFEYLILNNV